MEASTVGQRQSVAVQVDDQGNGVQEVQGVPPEQVKDPQFEAEDAQGDLAVESSADGNAAIRVTGASPNCAVTVTYTSAADQSGAGTDDHLQELKRLHDDGILAQEEYDTAVAKVNEGKSSDEAFQEARAQAAAVQSPAEPQTVPEQRPQAAVNPAPGAGVSEASKRFDAPGAEPMDAEAYTRAGSDEQMKSAAEASRMPNLTEGQRVQIIKGDEDGRMAHILQIHYTDGIQDMIAKSGTAEARFANVDHFVLRTRDGRSDLISVTPDMVKPLDDIEGWGRGQI